MKIYEPEKQESHIFGISDVELGKKDLMDDFEDEKSLFGFLEHLIKFAKNKNNTGSKILILNGDTFDFLKMDYKGEYPRYITAEISTWKMKQVFNYYFQFFDLLREFAALPNTEIHFIIGNHDFDLIWKEVQDLIQEKLNSENVYFSHTLNIGDFHIEHGNNYDIVFKLNIKKPIIKYKDQYILNLPFGYYGISQFLIDIKKNFRQEEKMHPRNLALKAFQNFGKQSKKISYRFIFQEMFLGLLRRFYDPTHKVPYLGIIEHFLTYGFHVVNEAHMLKKRFEIMIKDNPDQNYLVMGHVHYFKEMNIKGKTCGIIDTWRKEYDLENKGHEKEKTYLYIKQENSLTKLFELKKFQIEN